MTSVARLRISHPLTTWALVTVCAVWIVCGQTAFAGDEKSIAKFTCLFFLHFWAVDDAGHLSRGLRAALVLTKVKAPAS